MKNLKTTIITALLLLATVSGAVAQEKWECAIVYYNANEKVLSTSINGVDFERTEKVSSKTVWDLNPVIQKVNEMQERGWEVYNNAVSTAPNGVIYFLRKKKN